MSYSEKKEELVKLSDEVLREYSNLLPKVVMLCKQMNSIPKSKLTFNEQLDYASLLTQEASVVKAASLISALLYVEYPRNKKVINALKVDMDFNRRRRGKRIESRVLE